MDLMSLGWSPQWDGEFASHRQAQREAGRVAAVHRGRLRLLTARGEVSVTVAGRFAHENQADPAAFPVVGDWVAWQPVGETGVVHGVLQRANVFARKAPGEVSLEQPLAANLSILFLVTSANLDLNPRRLMRYLTLAHAGSVPAAILLNKSDLIQDPQSAAQELAHALGGGVVLALSARTGEGVDQLIPFLQPGLTCAFVGSSGVGKSTLVNRLLGDAVLATQPVRAHDDHGRHTTTRREMFLLPHGGMLIDTPGLRELQLWDAGAGLDGAFADVVSLAERCRFADCQHRDEPGCAVRAAISAGELDPDRLRGFAKLRREEEYLKGRTDARIADQRRKHWKAIHREQKRIYRDRDQRRR